MEVLHTSDLHHRFATGHSAITPLKGINLEMQSGQFVVIRGPSGSGKTTLLLACGAMRKPTSGSVHVAGQDVYALPAGDRAGFRSKKIGFLFQTMELIPYLSLLDNLLLVPGVKASQAQLWLEKLGLADRWNHKPYALSQGEIQRAALARAMVHDPVLVVADEPTGNLDPQNTQVVFESFQKFASDGGAVLVATHETDAIKAASKIYRLESGSLICETT